MPADTTLREAELSGTDAGEDRYEKVLEDAEKAQQAWSEYRGTLKGNFHLRACASYITVVSTNPVKPMNGCRVSLGRLSDKLQALSEAGDIAAALKQDAGFDHEGTAEDSLQAQIINDLNADSAGELKKALGVRELRFVASELILYRKGDARRLRPDVVALGDGKIFLIEMKTPDGSGDEEKQAREYVKYYRPMKEYYDLINSYLGNDLVASGKTDMIGVGMRGYRTNVVPCTEKVEIEGVLVHKLIYPEQ